MSNSICKGCCFRMLKQKSLKVLSDCRKYESSHQLPAAILQSSINMHHYYYWSRGRIMMGVVLITLCLFYPDWALSVWPISSYVFPLFFWSHTNCFKYYTMFYCMHMFISQVLDNIFQVTQHICIHISLIKTKPEVMWQFFLKPVF